GEHEVRLEARGDAAGVVRDPEELGRPFARHAHRLGEGEPEHRDRIAYAARHVDVGAGEPAVFVEAGVAVDGDSPPLQLEGAIVGADARHGVGDQHEAVVRLAAQRDAQHHGVRVRAVDDDAAPARWIFERGTYGAGLATGELRHGVEEVVEAAQAVTQRRADLRIGRVGVAGRDHDPARDEFLDDLRRSHFRSERHERAAARERGELPERARVEVEQLRRFVHALARYVKERALVFTVDHALYAGFVCMWYYVCGFGIDGHVG